MNHRLYLFQSILDRGLGRCRRQDDLPPLPSYEDATKLPPLIRPQLSEVEAVTEEEVVNDDSHSRELRGSGNSIAETNEETSTAQAPSTLLEPPAPIPHSASARMEIFTTESSSKFDKNLPARRSI
ncbi:unnamed protein product [Gongylonema pulchrum]|uniref:Uncharacterized protein n=1 Tax=Gongylonema pulchrum TaxID=637853 RepID=A0A183D8C9_9BILA|nr:unnamed protein product [Gongylonema pulchrum]